MRAAAVPKQVILWVPHLQRTHLLPPGGRDPPHAADRHTGGAGKYRKARLSWECAFDECLASRESKRVGWDLFQFSALIEFLC